MNFDGFNCRTASSTIDNNIDVSFEVKMYAEISFRLRNKDLRHACIQILKKDCANCTLRKMMKGLTHDVPQPTVQCCWWWEARRGTQHDA